MLHGNASRADRQRFLDNLRVTAALSEWLPRQLGTFELRGRRESMTLGFLTIAQAHHSSVVVLLMEDRPASALALIRPQFEACLRGLWVCYSATDAELDRCLAKDTLPSAATLVSRLSRCWVS